MALADADEETCTALSLGWALHSLGEVEGLVREVARLGVEPDPDRFLDTIRQRRHEIEGYQRRKRVRRVIRFPHEKLLAEKFGRSDELVTFAVSHELVHGSEFAISARRSLRGDVLAHFLHQGNILILGEVANFLIQSLLHAHRASCSIFHWPDPTWIRPFRERLDRLNSEIEALPEEAQVIRRG